VYRWCVVLISLLAGGATAEPAVRVEAESFEPVAGAPAWGVVTGLRDPQAACPGGLSGGASLGSNDPAARMRATVSLPPGTHYVWVRRYADGGNYGCYPFTVEINGRARVVNSAEPPGPAYVWDWWGRAEGGQQEIILRDPGSWSVVADCIVFTRDPNVGIGGPGPVAVRQAWMRPAGRGRTALVLSVEPSRTAAASAGPTVQSAMVSLEAEAASLVLPVLSRPMRLRAGRATRLPRATVATTYLPRGRYDVVAIVRADDATGTPTAYLAGAIEAPGRRDVAPCRAEVRPYLGRPTLFVNGEPHFGLAFIGPRLADVAKMARNGVRFMNLGGGAPELGTDGRWDFTPTDSGFLRLLAAEPDAYYFPRVSVRTPADLPDADRVQRHAADGSVSVRSQPSFGSETWLQAGEAQYRALAAHIIHSPYADRVIGIHVCAGDVGEWFQWSQGGAGLDVSPAMHGAFGRWLRERYGTQAALREAWGDGDACFEHPPIPADRDLLAADRGGFRDPARRAAQIDFMRCYNELVARALLRFCRAVKEGSDGRLLTGAFYGYTFGLHHWVYPTSGHLATEAALRSPDIDFLASPCGYGDRGVGGVSMYHQGVWSSLALHGKLFYGEADIRTHLCPADSTQAAYRSASTDAESVAVLQREFANCLTGGKTLWWFDMDGGWFDSAQMLQAIRRMGEIGTRELEHEHRSRAEVAVVIDPESWLYKAPVPEFDKALAHISVETLSRLGAPWDAYLLSDLGDARVPDYRLYIFLNAFHLSTAEREMVARKVKRGGATAVWVYAPGFADGRQTGLGLCEELTGIELGYDDTPGPVVVSANGGTTGNADPLAAAPLWYAVDAEAEVLGVLQANGKPGLVRKRLEDWVSVYSSAPLTNPQVLRMLARDAGVHIYSDSGDAFYLNDRLFGIHVGEAGSRHIRFPDPVAVTDLWTDKMVADGETDVVLDLPRYASGLYRYAPARR